MKLKVSAMMDAVDVLAAIINEKRPLPLKAKFRIARLYETLQGPYNLAREKRDEIIRPISTPLLDDNGAPTGRIKVLPEKLEEFMTQWSKVADDEDEFEVQPVPLDLLGEAGIEAHEFLALGPLVSE